MIMEKIKQSETLVIKRSQIKLNPINPKRHSDYAIKLQKKNLKKVGFLGGIVWNKTTGNLIDGHRRVLSMDGILKYDGTNDYDIKVEAVELDEKTEKEQLTYMAAGNTEPDLDLIAKYIGDIDPIDYSDLGFSDSELRDILAFNDYPPMINEPFEDFISQEGQEDAEKKKENVKSVKERVSRIADEREKQENAYITLSFGSYDAFSAFCDIFHVSGSERFLKGENVLKMIE